MKNGLDWRGTEKVEELCKIANLGQDCVTTINKYIRPAINPARPCDYRQEALNLISYSEGMQMFSFLYEKDFPLMNPLDKIAIIQKIADINADVIDIFAERMIQGCECRQKPIVRDEEMIKRRLSGYSG